MTNTDNRYEEYIELLKANKNLILTGAPGTGKTYLAKKIAEIMEADYEFVQFHPSYDYTDFVEGLRPTSPDGNGNIGFERKDGVFKDFCKRAISSLINCVNDKKTPKSDNNFSSLCTSSDVALSRSRACNTSNNIIIEPIDIIEYIETGIDIYSSKEHTKYHIDSIDDKYVYLSGKSIQGYKILFTDIIEAYKKRLWEGGQKNGKDSYRAALAKYIYEKIKCTKISILNTHANLIKNEDVNNICSTESYVFIIDEINRGELSKIFGELFFSIDPGYRGKKGLVKTQYQNLITDKSDPFYDGFYVPENVYIIGTMNDIDRSVESMDFAMRRRFAWKEVRADENTGMLDDLGSMKLDVVAKMNRLNEAIWNDATNDGIEGLSRAYHIGGAYFRKLKLYLNDDFSNKDEAYRKLWDNHLRGVLFEYLRGSIDAAENMKMLENVYFSE